MDNKQEFTLGQILTVTTGVLFCSVDEMYAITDFIMPDDAAYIIQQHPWLAEISVDSVTEHNWEQKLQELEEKYGKYHTLYSIPENNTIE